MQSTGAARPAAPAPAAAPAAAPAPAPAPAAAPAPRAAPAFIVPKAVGGAVAAEAPPVTAFGARRSIAAAFAGPSLTRGEAAANAVIALLYAALLLAAWARGFRL
jgi:hypothetical protein